MNLIQPIHHAGRQVAQGVSLFVCDVGNGMLEVFHNSLAMLGLAVLAGLVFVGTQPEVRDRSESLAFGWLHQRHLARAEASGDVLSAVSEPEGVGRATAADPAELNRQQGLVIHRFRRMFEHDLLPERCADFAAGPPPGWNR